jgi:hypothetical protein
LKVCISFKGLLQVPHEHFDHVLEWSSNEHRCHVSGIIHISKLATGDWWKQPNVSIILYPDGIIDNYQPVKERQEVALEFVEQLV